MKRRISFDGYWDLNKPLTKEYINEFLKTTHKSLGDWDLNSDRTFIGWNGIKKFNDFIPRIKERIKFCFEPWGYLLNGSMYWQGKEDKDKGKIIIKDNIIETYYF